MSLLWKTAANAGWWDARMRGDMPAMNRHRQQVADAHGVKDYQAGIALRPIYQALSHSRLAQIKPKDAGFASAPRENADGELELPFPHDHPLWEEDNWKHVPETQVNLKQPIHATQESVSANKVAHNLFHPGKMTPPDYEGQQGAHDIGSPDVDPDTYSHEERTNALQATPVTSSPRFYRSKAGQMYVADGHHATAAALMLKKSHITGRVWDDNNPPEGVR